MVVSFGPSEEAVKREYVFRTFDHPQPSVFAQKTKRKHRNPGKAHTDPIWKIARATSAAPKYFSPISIHDRRFRDGGMIANNPAEVALNEVLQMHKHRPRLLLSVGCGKPSPSDGKEVEKKVDFVTNWRDVAELTKQLLTQTQVTADRVEDVCESTGQPLTTYYRLNPDGVGDIPLDQWNPAENGADTKRSILEQTRIYLTNKTVHDHLMQCARSLVRTRRKREATERWESFAHRFVYNCPHPDCHERKAAKVFLRRSALREHLVCEHNLIVVDDKPIENQPGLRHVCQLDHCALRIHAFEQQQDFEDHLAREHQIQHPSFISRQRMEAWLNHS